jgi:hypothetical protein
VSEEERRTVTDDDGATPDTQMSAIGVSIALGVGVFLLPLAPLLAVLYGLRRLRRAVGASA